MSDEKAIALTVSAMERLGDRSPQQTWRRLPTITTSSQFPLAHPNRPNPPSDPSQPRPLRVSADTAEATAVSSWILCGCLSLVSVADFAQGQLGAGLGFMAADAALAAAGGLAWRIRGRARRQRVAHGVAYDKFPMAWTSSFDGRFARLPLYLPEVDALRWVTVSAVESVVSSASWRSPDFDMFGLRMNLKTELNDIDAQAYRIGDALASIGPRPVGKDEISAQAAQLWDSTRARLDPAWNALRERVGALIRYRNQIAELDQQLDNLASLRRLDAASSKIDALAVGTVIDEMATVRLTELAERIEIIRRAIRETIALSDGTV